MGQQVSGQRVAGAPQRSEMTGLARLSVPTHWLVRAAWFAAAGLSIAIVAAFIVVALNTIAQILDPSSSTGVTHLAPAAIAPGIEKAIALVGVLINVLAALICVLLAVLVFQRRSDDRMAVFVSFLLLWTGTVYSGPLERLEAYIPGIAVFTTDVLQMAPNFTLFVLLMCLFPNGRFVPSWTRILPLITISLLPLTLVLFVRDGTLYREPTFWLTVPLWLAPTLIAVGALVYRYRRVANPTERQQSKWIIYGFAIWAVLAVLSSVPYFISRSADPVELPPWLVIIGALAWYPSLLVMPLALTVAVLRYHLWDIDFIINRTLVYGLLTALVAGVYILIAGLLGALLHMDGDLEISLAGAAAVAILFQPVRERVQRVVNRLMFGQRNEPYTVLKQLAERLEVVLASQSVLPVIAETVADAFRLPYVAIALKRGARFKVVAEYRRRTYPEKRPGEAAEIFPLIYQSDEVGRLILAPRSPGGRFSAGDRQLLETIARQAGVVVHNVRLHNDLQRSRRQLVTTREEERRRLRRDLHDGLGPVLASMSFRLDAILNAVDRDTATAKTLATEVKAQTQQALADIRRIAYDLRPPALDELGLVGALREHILAFSEGSILLVTLDAPDGALHLPAAVEVATYRIALEALTNVVRHAHARHCMLTLSLNGALSLEVRDDGRGLPTDYHSGVGITSIRERAEELGGACMIETIAAGGTRVIVTLPLTAEADHLPEARRWNLYAS